ncbi:hypothetical protein [Vreelandella profundi]|uniref:hypothetical protein n=1 Tax=Vreelandella profundi TaxID=2852117 RepID=UPI001F1FA185|nr:hypothetical protein [Halomonas profundi]
MSFLERYYRYVGKHKTASSDSSEEEPNPEPLGLGKRSSPDEHNEEDWTETKSPEQTAQGSEELRKRHNDELDRDRVARHTQGTQQVEQIITRTKAASRNFLRLSVIGAITIFTIGIFSLPQTRELLNFIPRLELDMEVATSGHWIIYLLLFLPTTLMAVLGITLWITGLKFSAQIYGGMKSEEGAASGTLSECVKTLGEIAKQSGNSSP